MYCTADGRSERKQHQSRKKGWRRDSNYLRRATKQKQGAVSDHKDADNTSVLTDSPRFEEQNDHDIGEWPDNKDDTPAPAGFAVDATAAATASAQSPTEQTAFVRRVLAAHGLPTASERDSPPNEVTNGEAVNYLKLAVAKKLPAKVSFPGQVQLWPSQQAQSQKQPATTSANNRKSPPPRPLPMAANKNTSAARSITATINSEPVHNAVSVVRCPRTIVFILFHLLTIMASYSCDLS